MTPTIEIKRAYVTSRGAYGIVGTIDGRTFSRFIKAGETPEDAVLRVWGVDLRAADLDPELEWYTGLDLRRQETLTDEHGSVLVEQMRGAKGWLAQITGTGGKFGLKRRFCKPDQYALSRSGRGDKVWRTRGLGDGVYEASSTWRSMTEHRTHFVVRAGHIAIIERCDIVRYL